MSKRKEKPHASRQRETQKIRAIYAKSRREFTAADLQKFTVVE
jgi:hypothetical protein